MRRIARKYGDICDTAKVLQGYYMVSTINRVSTVYQPYINRVCTVVVGVRLAHREGNYE